MGKLLKIIGITGAVVFVFLIIAKLSGMIQYYIVPDNGNEPTIKAYSWVFASNLIKPEKYKLILHERNDSVNEVWVQRLCGVEGDKIEIISGFLHVNDSLVDDKLILNHSYLVDERHKNWLIKNNLKVATEFSQYDEKNFFVNISSPELNKNLHSKRFIFEIVDDAIFETFNQPWSLDNFGPVIVPKDKLFLLGDNRNYSYDSRQIGFVDKSNVIGVIIGND